MGKKSRRNRRGRESVSRAEQTTPSFDVRRLIRAITVGLLRIEEAGTTRAPCAFRPGAFVPKTSMEAEPDPVYAVSDDGDLLDPDEATEAGSTDHPDVVTATAVVEVVLQRDEEAAVVLEAEVAPAEPVATEDTIQANEPEIATTETSSDPPQTTQSLINIDVARALFDMHEQDLPASDVFKDEQVRCLAEALRLAPIMESLCRGDDSLAVELLDRRRAELSAILAGLDERLSALAEPAEAEAAVEPKKPTVRTTSSAVPTATARLTINPLDPETWPRYICQSGKDHFKPDSPPRRHIRQTTRDDLVLIEAVFLACKEGRGDWSSLRHEIGIRRLLTLGQIDGIVLRKNRLRLREADKLSKHRPEPAAASGRVSEEATEHPAPSGPASEPLPTPKDAISPLATHEVAHEPEADEPLPLPDPLEQVPEEHRKRLVALRQRLEGLPAFTRQASEVTLAKLIELAASDERDPDHYLRLLRFRTGVATLEQDLADLLG